MMALLVLLDIMKKIIKLSGNTLFKTGVLDVDVQVVEINAGETVGELDLDLVSQELSSVFSDEQLLLSHCKLLIITRNKWRSTSLPNCSII